MTYSFKHLLGSSSVVSSGQRLKPKEVKEDIRTPLSTLQQYCKFRYLPPPLASPDMQQTFDHCVLNEF